jgi:diguanylate cyclase (GGDEF)-like protein
MTDKDYRLEGIAEEIEGAPPVLSTAEVNERRASERLSINRYAYQQTQQFAMLLLEAVELDDFLDVLLTVLPRNFGCQANELWLHDPEGELDALLPTPNKFGNHLQLHADIYTMQELYDVEPDVEIMDATDPRMFEILKAGHGIGQALLLPLTDGGRLIGSLHCGSDDLALFQSPAEEALLAHLAAVISRCLQQRIVAARVGALNVLDPLTQAMNQRGFSAALDREISRAQRERRPLSLVLMAVDELPDLQQHYGNRAADFALKRVVQRITADMRATDNLAVLDDLSMALLLPGSGEVRTREIAERQRVNVGGMAIDDGRGAALQVTLSIGLATWEPEHYPAVDMVQLALQLQAAADKALNRSRSDMGDKVSVARLATLLV